MGKVSYKRARWRSRETAVEARLRLLQGYITPKSSEHPEPDKHTDDHQKTKRKRTGEILAACDDNQVPIFTSDPSIIQRKPYELPLQERRSWSDLRNKIGTHGRFTKAEDQLIRTQLQKYFEMEGVSWNEGMNCLIWRKENHSSKKGIRDSPWKMIASPLPDRHIESVIQYVQSQIYEWPKRGLWSVEEDIRLVGLVAEIGKEWKEISRRMGRFWKSCNDHYRDLTSRNVIDELLERAQAPIVIEDEKGGDGGGEETTSTRDATPVAGEDQFRMDRFRKAQRARRGRWDDEEDDRLLRMIREVTKLEFPISRVPWTYIGVKLGAEKKGRTKSDLRKRYVTHLLPARCSRQVSEFHASCRREIFRYILQAVQTNPEVEWDELMFNKVIPFWTPDRINYIAGRCFQRYLINQRIGLAGGEYLGQILNRKKIMESSCWKTLLPDVCKAMGISKYMEHDHQVISDYLKAIAEANGGTASVLHSRTGTIKLPIDSDLELMKNFTRKKLRDLYAYETQRATEGLEAEATKRTQQQPSTSFLDHALDLLIEGPTITDETPNSSQSLPSNSNGQSLLLSPTSGEGGGGVEQQHCATALTRTCVDAPLNIALDGVV